MPPSGQDDHRCELCGTPVRVVSSRDGTAHYEPSRRAVLEALVAEAHGDDDWASGADLEMIGYIVMRELRDA